MHGGSQLRWVCSGLQRALSRDADTSPITARELVARRFREAAVVARRSVARLGPRLRWHISRLPLPVHGELRPRSVAPCGSRVMSALCKNVQYR